MKRTMQGLFVVVFLMICAGAHAKSGDARPLCTPPLPDGCVQPQWGQIDPTVDSADAQAQPDTALAPSASPVAGIRMMATQYPSPKSPQSAAPKLIVDDGENFKAETQALVSALKRATFDAKGQIVSGAAEIAAAAERVQRVAVGHQLNLYIKTQKKLKPDAAMNLGKKVQSVNAILGGHGGPSQGKS